MEPKRAVISHLGFIALKLAFLHVGYLYAFHKIKRREANCISENQGEGMQSDISSLGILALWVLAIKAAFN